MILVIENVLGFKNDVVGIKEQVITYEQSKRLKELGITASAYFVWMCNAEGTVDVIPYSKNIALTKEDILWAYGAVEVEIMIPDGDDDNIRTSAFTYRLYDWAKQYKNGYRYASYICDTHTHDKYQVYGRGYAECVCNMLIYLLEQEEMKPSKCNKRLKQIK